MSDVGGLIGNDTGSTIESVTVSRKVFIRLVKMSADFAPVECAYSNCYCFAESVDFFSSDVIDNAYYYADGCSKTVSEYVVPIEMNGTTMI